MYKNPLRAQQAQASCATCVQYILLGITHRALPARVINANLPTCCQPLLMSSSCPNHCSVNPVKTLATLLLLLLRCTRRSCACAAAAAAVPPALLGGLVKVLNEVGHIWWQQDSTKQQAGRQVRGMIQGPQWCDITSSRSIVAVLQKLVQASCLCIRARPHHAAPITTLRFAMHCC